MLVLAGVLAAPSYGLSLYDSAPPIGLPESYAARYGVYMNVGYDSNLNNTDRNRQDGGFVRYGVTASYADNESVTKASYNARIGAQLYNKTANGADQRNFSDISVSGRLSHAFSAGSQYTGNVELRYCPEPDYANGISAANTQGDCFNWHIGNAYSRMIDCRWSWTANVGYNGNIYSDTQYQVDDRTYLSGGLSLNMRYDARTTYGINTSIRHEDRKEGFDSDSWFTTLSMSHALSPVDSFSVALGFQGKFIDSNNDFYPTLNLSYRRVLTQGVSANVYVSFQNENIDTYFRSTSQNYLSNETWRVGASLAYAYTPTVTFSVGSDLLASSYSKGTNGARDYDRSTWSAYVGMSYKFTQRLTGNVRYTYTYGDTGGMYGVDHYNRDVISAGLTYTF